MGDGGFALAAASSFRAHAGSEDAGSILFRSAGGSAKKASKRSSRLDRSSVTTGFFEAGRIHASSALSNSEAVRP